MRQAKEQQRLWEQRAPAAYSFEYQQNCFCLANALWWRVEVRDSRVERATLMNPADTVATAAQTPLAEHPTIATIFDRLTHALAIEGATVRAAYHPAQHYPTAIDVDEAKDIADDEWRLTVRNVRPL